MCSNACLKCTLHGCEPCLHSEGWSVTLCRLGLYHHIESKHEIPGRCTTYRIEMPSTQKGALSFAFVCARPNCIKSTQTGLTTQKHIGTTAHLSCLLSALTFQLSGHLSCRTSWKHRWQQEHAAFVSQAEDARLEAQSRQQEADRAALQAAEARMKSAAAYNRGDTAQGGILAEEAVR